MSAPSHLNSVWIRPLGAAWKLRVGSSAAAEPLREALIADGWKCTTITAAFDVPDTVLFRASDANGDRERAIEPSLRSVAGVELQTDPA